MRDGFFLFIPPLLSCRCTHKNNVALMQHGTVQDLSDNWLCTYILSETSKRLSTIISGRKSSLNEEVMFLLLHAVLLWQIRMFLCLSDSTTVLAKRQAGTGAGGLPKAAARAGSCHILSPSCFPPIPSEIYC